MLRLTPWLSAAAFAGCKACAGCVDSPPSDDQVRNDTDVEDTADTGDSTPPEDTAPPPPCDVPETEPNDGLSDANALPLEHQACGTFSEEGDGEWLVFPGEDAEWLRVDVDAASRGSAARVGFSLVSRETGDLTVVYPTAGDEDPWIVFPALGVSEYHLYLSEGDGLFGEDFGWWILASEDKAPVEWTREEVEANDLPSEAEDALAGDVVFGKISSSFDYDWFHIAVPASEEKVTWNFTIEAWSSGSPLAARLSLYGPEILGGSVDDVRFLATAHHDDATLERDPAIEFQSQEATDWYLLVKMPQEEAEENAGSTFHWYTLTIANDLQER